MITCGIRFQLPFAWLSRSVPDLPQEDQGLRQSPRHHRHYHRQLRCYHVRSPLSPLTSASLAFTRIRSSSGGAIAGSVSQYIGRRLTIIIFVFFSGAFIPLWILPSSFSGLAAGAFWVQFGVQGAWGVIPIQLAEMSPPGFRATFPGVAYQLGNVRRVHVLSLSFGGSRLTRMWDEL
jgi:hypothetical protein